MPRRIAAPLLLAMAVGAAAASAWAGSDTRTPVLLTSGTVVQVRMLRAGPDGARLPAIVVLGGLERGAAILDLLPPTPEAVLVSFDYPYRAPRRASWNALPQQTRDAQHGIDDTLGALSLLYDRLSQRSDIDSSRLTLAGVSLGAPLALVGAAQRDYRGVVLVDGFGDIAATLRHRLAQRWSARWGALAYPLAFMAQTSIMAWMKLPDPEADASRLRADQRVYVLEAQDDDQVPESARRTLRAALARSQAQLSFDSVPGRHVRGADAQAVAERFLRVRAWLQRQGLTD